MALSFMTYYKFGLLFFLVLEVMDLQDLNDLELSLLQFLDERIQLSQVSTC